LIGMSKSSTALSQCTISQPFVSRSVYCLRNWKWSSKHNTRGVHFVATRKLLIIASFWFLFSESHRFLQVCAGDVWYLPCISEPDRTEYRPMQSIPRHIMHLHDFH
jgi:hypothetical protein